MPNEPEVLAEARQEFDDAFRWYSERSEAAALGFVAEIDDVIEKISTDPRRFPLTYAGCRRCRLRHYPYSVVFCCQPERIVIIAIAHAKRRPGYWRSRPGHRA